MSVAMPMQLLQRGAALTLLALAAACSPQPSPWHGHDVTGVLPDLHYRLTGENGAAQTADRFAGEIRLLFFGYTRCPDVCPTTLARIKAALASLEPQQRQRLRVLFVSVDPARDGPQQLSRYLAHFGPRFVGLTGSTEQLDTLTRRYRVSYGYGERDAAGRYAVSHSSGTFVFDADGRARLLLDQRNAPSDIAADLQRLLKQTAPG